MRQLPHVPGVPSREESRTTANDPSEAIGMFPNSDPYTQLELHRQHVAEMIREAAGHRWSREVSTGRHRRLGRWRRAPARRPAAR
jgi:hypothetical protein